MTYATLGFELESPGADPISYGYVELLLVLSLHVWFFRSTWKIEVLSITIIGIIGALN